MGIIAKAQGKKSFLLYADYIHTVRKLSNEQAGELFKHILSYVNDEHPVADSFLTEIAFEPIKQGLKRDLQRWEGIRVNRSESGWLGGLKGGEVRKQNEANEASASISKQNEANEAVNDTVTVTVNDTVNVTESVNDKENVYLSQGHLSITVAEFNKLDDEYGHEKTTDGLYRVLEPGTKPKLSM